MNQAAKQVEGLLDSGELIRLKAAMERQFSNLGSSDVDGAIGTGVEKVIQRDRCPTNVFGYIRAVAANEIKRAHRLDSLMPTTTQVDIDHLLDESGDQPEFPGDLLERCQRHVADWETASVRETMLLYLDAAERGDAISSDEATEAISEVLGYEASPESVRSWKRRGIDRLRSARSELFETQDKEIQ